MKKIFTLIAILTLTALGVHAQTDTLLYENFDVDNTANWPVFYSGSDTTWVDYDADVHADFNNRPLNWYWRPAAYGTDDTTGCLFSSSWFSVSAAAKNFLITPPISVANASAQISWKSAPYQTPLYLDGYKVLVSTTDNVDASFTDTIFVAAEYLSTLSAGAGGDYSMYSFSPGYVHGEDGTYVEPNADVTILDRNVGVLHPFTASLAAYAGQTIYVAFLHDSFDDNLLALDDVLVTQSTTIGISETTKNDNIRIYPNPVSDKLNLEYNLTSASSVDIKMFDTKGVVVKSVTRGNQPAGTQKLSFNVQDFPAGAYSVSIMASGKISHTTVVINH